LGSDSPTAAQHNQQHEHNQQQQRLQRRPFKMHGMDPYEYWSLIKGL
jgi:hypothetical protein